ncbi:MAG: divalent cation tolerance protein CutA [Bacteroidia bacterium]|nr:divalent cation tolerance protein CutA [Bacteroidia bacterium]
MILINIASENEEIIHKVVAILLKEQLALDVNYKKNVKRLKNIDGQIKEHNLYVITAKTKALLFSKIETILKEHFKHQMPELYSLPITLMELTQAEELKNNTQKI